MASKASTVASVQSHASHKCPICNRSESISHLCDVSGYKIYTCSYCKCDHTLPVPSARDLKAYYDRQEWFEGGEHGGYSNYDEQTEWSLPLYEKILHEYHGATSSPSVLDIGCGYGTHLAVARALGWKCFGVELSEHARRIALERLDQDAQIVERVEDLVPHRFDVVTIFDTIEHLSEPYQLFFALFSLGAIDETTTVVFTTPNAESFLATKQPATWAYRHPPSHLTYYSGASFRHFLSVLRFKVCSIEGQSRIKDGDGLDCFDGLLVRASGSDFGAFMQERYVPGTWSKIAEYEHVPRYALAASFVEKKRVLDFGCGTGYGAAMLARTAASVCGLDIDADAIVWAKSQHRANVLEFIQSSDFGDSLPAASFDLATCFEMIEHVDHASQLRTIDSIARLLTPDGHLIISTPNPEITQLYGANPYHLREMSREEFEELLKPHFNFLQILDQFAHPGVFFSAKGDRVASSAAPMDDLSGALGRPPLAFVAICSKSATPPIAGRFFYDGGSDFVSDFVEQQALANRLKYENYAANERVNDLENRVAQHASGAVAIAELRDAGLAQSNEIHRLNLAVAQKDDAVARQIAEIRRLEQVLVTRDAGLHQQNTELQRLHDAVIQRDLAVAEQATDIRRLHKSFVDFEAGLHLQSTEIHRLNEVVVQKDLAVAQQTTEIRRLETALHLQSTEIHRLNEVVVQKDLAVVQQTTEIRRLETALHLQSTEIHRINEVVVHKDLAVAQQTTEIRKLETALVEREGELREQSAEVHRLHAAVAQRDVAIARQDTETLELGKMLVDHASRLHEQSAEILQLNDLALERKQAIATLQFQLGEQTQHGMELAGEVSGLRTSVADLLADTRASLSAARELRAGLWHWQSRFNTLNESRWVSLGHALTARPITLRSLQAAATALLSLGTPTGLKRLIIRNRDERVSVLVKTEHTGAQQMRETHGENVYQVRTPHSPAIGRPRVLHIIANFCTGGSSRLVVDLIERLGAQYEQRILTSFIPSPPAYTGIDICEIRSPENERPFTQYMVDYAPDFLHVHYWGDCDEPWYASAISAANKLGLSVIQNINTPVSPYVDSSIVRNVYVSDYVRTHFGHELASDLTIHPGSDFALFSRGRASSTPECVGMVYRLERDKLDEAAIRPFIVIAKHRPQTRVLIVGGGSLLEPFQQAVRDAGVEKQFEFTGYVPYAQLPKLYEQMALFVAPVWKESFGQVSPFAMSMGVAVCGYDVGALAEITGTPFTLAPAGDHEKLAEIVIDLLSSPEKRSDAADMQSARARSYFSIEAMIAAYEKLYGEVYGLSRKS